MLGKEIENKLILLQNEKQAKHLSRFFKTGKGEYGEGDKFLGIRVPITRNLVKEYRLNCSLEDVEYLTQSHYHEVRLAGFLLLIEIYNYSQDKDIVVKKYLSLLERGNNWDLVDLIAPKILGEYLVENIDKRDILHNLSDDKSLWLQRVAIVSCFTLIKNQHFEDALVILKKYLTHSHDLIHKASGWMLREIGKRGGREELIKFLENYASVMPRTMLRYAIEKLSMEEKEYFMKKD